MIEQLEIESGSIDPTLGWVLHSFSTGMERNLGFQIMRITPAEQRLIKYASLTTRTKRREIEYFVDFSGIGSLEARPSGQALLTAHAERLESRCAG